MFIQLHSLSYSIQIQIFTFQYERDGWFVFVPSWQHHGWYRVMLLLVLVLVRVPFPFVEMVMMRE